METSQTQSEIRRREAPEPLERGEEFVFERTARENGADFSIFVMDSASICKCQ